MIDIISFWAFMGTIQLLIASWKDYVNNMKVDDRYNFFMLGASISLIPYNPHNIFYMLPLMLIVPLLYIFIKKIKALGEGDQNSIAWLFIGYYIIGIDKVIFFLIFFAGVLLILIPLRYYLVPKALKKINPKLNTDIALPFYPILFITFVMVNILLRFYG